MPGIPILLSNYHFDLDAFQRNHAVRSGLIIGDLVYGMAIQFAVTKGAISFVEDQKQAVCARQDHLRFAIAGRVLIGGMHIPFSGIGRIRFAPGAHRICFDALSVKPIEKPGSIIQSIRSICLRAILF